MSQPTTHDTIWLNADFGFEHPSAKMIGHVLCGLAYDCGAAEGRAEFWRAAEAKQFEAKFAAHKLIAELSSELAHAHAQLADSYVAAIGVESHNRAIDEAIETADRILSQAVVRPTGTTARILKDALRSLKKS